MYKVDKRKLKSEIKILEIVIENLEQINNLAKKYYSKTKDISNILYGYDNKLNEAKKLYQLLNIRLNCKHEIIDDEKYEKVYCSKCQKFSIEGLCIIGILSDWYKEDNIEYDDRACCEKNWNNNCKEYVNENNVN
jgi:hypothetical protein